jgi:archaellin
MIGTKTAAGLIAFVVVASVCAAVMPFTSVAKGDQSEQQTARQVVARSATDWQAVWKAHSPTEKVPAVDLTTHMVVGVFVGTRPSAGYSVEITGVKTEGTAMIVEYVERRPKPGMIAAQILTQPFHLVSVEQHADPVRFVQVPDGQK